MKKYIPHKYLNKDLAFGFYDASPEFVMSVWLGASKIKFQNISRLYDMLKKQLKLCQFVN